MASQRCRDCTYYVQHYAPYDKAGAYGVQEWIGFVGVTRLEGSYFNVMGLPICEITQIADKQFNIQLTKF